jgi:hypothetical protein
MDLSKSKIETATSTQVPKMLNTPSIAHFRPVSAKWRKFFLLAWAFFCFLFVVLQLQ